MSSVISGVAGYGLACVAWRFKLFFEREWSGEAAKTSGEAARNRLPGWPVFFIAAPITLFDNPMTSFVNYNRKLPAIKTKLLFARLRRRARLSMAEIEKNVNIIVNFAVVRSRSNSEYLNMQNLSKVSKCEELHFVRKLKLARNWHRKIRRVIWSCVTSLCTQSPRLATPFGQRLK